MWSSALPTRPANTSPPAAQRCLVGNALGFDFAEMLAVVTGLQPSDFYKSMTTHADLTIWQDVYRSSPDNGYVNAVVAAWA
jgi:hypothetical protein